MGTEKIIEPCKVFMYSVPEPEQWKLDKKKTLLAILKEANSFEYKLLYSQERKHDTFKYTRRHTLHRQEKRS